MEAIAKVRRQNAHNYGRSTIVGKLTEMSPREGTCTFALGDTDQLITILLSHLVELREAEAGQQEGVDYLALARQRGWRGQ